MYNAREHYYKNRERIAAQRKQFRETHKELVLARNTAYREKHREEINARARTHYQEVKAKKLEHEREFYAQNKERIRARQNGWTVEQYRDYRSIRQEVGTRAHPPDRRVQLIHMLGGAKCVRCGYDSDVRALQIDHIHGGGSKELREGVGSRARMYLYYLEHPEEAKQKLQVLCANCNWIKKFANYEQAGSVKHRIIANMVNIIKP